MSDNHQKDGQPIAAAATQGEDKAVSGLGALLKAEREKRGLSLQQVSEETRLRLPLIEALESEAWDRLPPPVFVRGFVRSYTRALGLDEKKILNLYDEITPIEARTPKLVPRPSKRKRGPLLLFLFFLLIVAGILYVWLEFPPVRETLPSRGGTSVTLPEEAKPFLPSSSLEPGPKVNAGEPEVASQPPGEASPVPPVVSEEPAKALTAGETSQRQAEVPPEGAIAPPPQTSPAPPVADEPFVLKAVVHERTWVKVSVDGAEPKEYIFQAGSSPQWKAREGLEIMVGNAGGIEFEFNGEKIADLGESGKVVRLRLPKNYRATGSLN